MNEELRPMPHAVMIEKAVLSVILQYPEMIDEAPGLTPEHFYQPGPKMLFEKIRERLQSGKSIELVGFMQWLNDVGILQRIGGQGAITDIYTYQAGKNDFRHHVEELTRKLARRMAIEAGHEIIRTAFESEDDADLLDVTSSPITAIHDALVGNRETISKQVVLRDTLYRFQQLCEGKADPVGIETSLSKFNQYFKGLHHGQVVVISGYPGEGKTTLATQLAVDAAMGGRNVLIVSLEMPATAMMNRILAYVARRPGEAITDPEKYCRETLETNAPTKDFMLAITRAAKTIHEASIEIEDLTGANVHKIAACIRRAHRKKPLDVVVVDFAQRIRPTPDMRNQSREQQLSHASNHLADITKELGFCLLLPSQLNKEGAAKHAEAINEDADLHLTIAKDQSGIGVVKDRHHGCHGGKLPIVLDGPMLRFIPKPFEP